jgi:chromosome segregation ATPase
MEHEDVLLLEKKIAGLLEYCEELRGKCSHLEEVIKDKDGRIAELEAEVSSLNEQRSEVRNRIEALVSRIDELNIDGNEANTTGEHGQSDNTEELPAL